MYEARRNKRMTFRELSKVTGIPIGRLSALERGREVPIDLEIEEITKALGPDIEFEMDYDKAQKRHNKTVDTITSIYMVKVEAIERHGEESGTGTMECPSCGNKLYYSISGINQHVWGKCEKEGCLSWIE